MHRLDLETLLQVLRDRTGQLRAEITGIPRTKGTYQVLVVLQQGQVTACVIHNQQGKKFDGEQARQILQGRTLEWTYEEQHVFTNLTQPAPSLSNNQAWEQASPSQLTRSSARLPAIPRQYSPQTPPQYSPRMPQQYSPRTPQQYSPQGYTTGYENSPSSVPLSGRVSPRDLLHIPRRIGLPSEQIVQSWSRQQRSIFSLIDGNHSIAMIAALLHIDEAQTLTIIYEMANQRLVTF